MLPFDYQADAARAMEVVLKGGIAIIPTTVGYVSLATTTEAIGRIVRVKQRGPAKLNAMVGNKSLHAALHVLDARSRQAVRLIAEGYDLPMGTVGPADLSHPVMRGLDPEVPARTTREGTIAMLMNAGPPRTS